MAAAAPVVTGIVLAGGRATRFGSNKLAAAVHGRALLEYPIDALSRLCAEIIVVVGPSDAPPRLTRSRVPVHVARDEAAGGGPVAGLVAGLEKARSPIVLIAAGDMPSMVPAVLGLLVRRIVDGADAAGLVDGDAMRPLPCALRRVPALAAARSAPWRSGLRDVLRRLAAVAVPEGEWQRLDPEGRTLLDVDRPEDVERIADDRPT